MSKSKNKILTLCEGAICIAMAWALSYIELDIAWLQGGSIGVTMIPLFIFAMRRGAGWGVLAGFVFGTIKLLVGGHTVTWESIVFDYSIAYAMVGLSGLFTGKNKWFWSVLIGGLARFTMHFISGFTIYAEWMPEKFMGLNMSSPFIYSFLYNGAYMFTSMIICMLILYFITKNKGIKKFINE